MGAGAIALFVVLFLFKWYGVSSSSSVPGVRFDASANGWHSFTNSRWLWLVTIVLALAVVALRAADVELRSAVQPGEIVAALGGLSMIFIVYRILDHPTAGASGTIDGVRYAASAGIKAGIWLGLIAAAAIAYGGYLAMQEQGTSLQDVPAQAGGALSGLVSAGRGRVGNPGKAFSGLVVAREAGRAHGKRAAEQGDERAP